MFSYYKQVLVLATVVLAFAFPHSARAAIVINEVFPNPSGDSSEASEFIELYNTDENEAVDISGYQLEESKTYTIENVIIEPHGFVSFTRADTGLALNNSGDTISLRDAEGEILDSFTFDEIDEDVSWSRYPDGLGEFVLTETRTPSSANSEPPTPTPTPTTILPTPSNSPTFMPSSTVTSTPTMKETPTPTRKPESTPPIREDTRSPFYKDDLSQISEDNVLSESDETGSDNYGNGRKTPLPSILLVIGGLMFVGVAFYLKFFKRV